MKDTVELLKSLGDETRLRILQLLSLAELSVSDLEQVMNLRMDKWPDSIGSFTSNVDMKTGAPAFGTPEYAKAAKAAPDNVAIQYALYRQATTYAGEGADAAAAQALEGLVRLRIWIVRSWTGTSRGVATTHRRPIHAPPPTWSPKR